MLKDENSNLYRTTSRLFYRPEEYGGYLGFCSISRRSIRFSDKIKETINSFREFTNIKFYIKEEKRFCYGIKNGSYEYLRK